VTDPADSLTLLPSMAIGVQVADRAAEPPSATVAASAQRTARAMRRMRMIVSGGGAAGR
jgi:hypothetical protein